VILYRILFVVSVSREAGPIGKFIRGALCLELIFY
jgi:hypothetical protein